MKVYSAKQVTVSFNGIPIRAGRGDGDFVRIEPTEVSYTLKTGVDGESTRSETGNPSQKVTIILMQTSDGNDIFSAILTGDLKSATGLGIGNLAVRDLQGRSVLNDPEGFIEGWPSQTFGKEAGTIEWSFLCPDPVRFLGGN